MPPNSRPHASESNTASLLQRFDALLEALRPVLAEDRSDARGCSERSGCDRGRAPSAKREDPATKS